jgi:hypothetical protein
MQMGQFQLRDDLRPQDSFESMHVMYLLNLQKIAWDCLKEVPRNKVDLQLREINLRFSLKATETIIRLYDQLEGHWAAKNSMPSGVRILHRAPANYGVGVRRPLSEPAAKKSL